jgi:hypothetical protein
VRSISKKVAVVCLLLTVWSAAALAAHHHSSATESTRCPVCVTSHSAAPKAIAPLPQAKFVYASAPVLETISAQQRLIFSALRVRPPPSFQ